jgi:hypothetical protein
VEKRIWTRGVGKTFEGKNVSMEKETGGDERDQITIRDVIYR